MNKELNRAMTPNHAANSRAVVLVNDFHSTKATVRTQVLWHGVHCEITLTASQMKRARRILCGIKGCTCGGPGGIRGPQAFRGKKLVVNVFPR